MQNSICHAKKEESVSGRQQKSLLQRLQPCHPHFQTGDKSSRPGRLGDMIIARCSLCLVNERQSVHSRYCYCCNYFVHVGAEKSMGKKCLYFPLPSSVLLELGQEVLVLQHDLRVPFRTCTLSIYCKPSCPGIQPTVENPVFERKNLTFEM
jgi:hypothetical protein